MKTPVLIALFMGCIAVPGMAADKAAELITKGQTAEKNGDMAGAKTAYTEAMQADPGNPNARYLMAQLEKNGPAIAARARAKQLSEIKLEQVNFDNLTFTEAIEALSTLTEKASGEKKFSPNFMVQDPAGKLGTQTLTLKLKGVPAKAALDMLLGQVGAKARYDEHAVVITPGG